jgi:hypothetical protein
MLDPRPLIVVLIGVAASCQPAGAVTSGPLRRGRVELVVLHSTGGPTCDEHGKPIWVPGGELDENLRTIERHPKLGVHFMIGRDGDVRSSVPENRVAHHVFRYSARSLGIELVNDGDGIDPFPAAQIDALVSLLRRLTEQYGIGREGIRRHSDLDHGRLPCALSRPRKVDPGAAFPYEDVLRRVFDSRRGP